MIREEMSKAQKSAWIPSLEFLEELKKHIGQDIRMRWEKSKNQRIRLIDVSNGTAKIEKSGNIEKIFVEKIDGFTTKEEWFNQRKKK